MLGAQSGSQGGQACGEAGPGVLRGHPGLLRARLPGGPRRGFPNGHSLGLRRAGRGPRGQARRGGERKVGLRVATTGEDPIEGAGALSVCAACRATRQHVRSSGAVLRFGRRVGKLRDVTVPRTGTRCLMPCRKGGTLTLIMRNVWPLGQRFAPWGPRGRDGLCPDVVGEA